MICVCCGAVDVTVHIKSGAQITNAVLVNPTGTEPTATNGLTTLYYVTNAIYNATNGFSSFDTNQAAITLTNGLNLLTNGTLTLYGVGFGDGSNYKYSRIQQSATSLDIGTYAAGTGAATSNGMPIVFSTWGTNRMTINPNGTLVMKGLSGTNDILFSNVDGENGFRISRLWGTPALDAYTNIFYSTISSSYPVIQIGGGTVVGDAISIGRDSSATYSAIAFGFGAKAGRNMISIGLNAGNGNNNDSNSPRPSNVAIGVNAMRGDANTYGYYNVAIGAYSMYTLLQGSTNRAYDCTAIGTYSGFKLGQTNTNAIAIGSAALSSNSTCVIGSITNPITQAAIGGTDSLMLWLGLNGSTNAAVYVGTNILAITQATDMQNTNTVSGAKFDIVNKTNILYGTTTVTNLSNSYLSSTNHLSGQRIYIDSIITAGTETNFFLSATNYESTLQITNNGVTNITFYTTNLMVGKYYINLDLYQAHTNQITLNFETNNWRWVGNSAPTALASNKWAQLSLKINITASSTNIMAGYAVEP